MLDLKNGGKVRGETRSTSRSKPRPSKPLPLAEVLKGLSFSFYGAETIRKQKQIILDPYEFLDQLPAITPALPKQTGRKKRNLASVGQRKQQGLIIDGLVFEGKCNQIELATTNDSRIEYKPVKKGRKSSMSQRENSKGGKGSVDGRSDRQKCRSVCSQSRQNEKKSRKK